jgi:glycolate oxidase subunit GlcD
MLSPDVLREIRSVLGEGGLLSDPDELLAYECDGLTFHRAAPDVVAFPRSTEQVAALVALARRHGLPVVARGSGTGLSGGAVAVRGGIVLETSRMRAIHPVESADRSVVVEPGVINVEVSRRVAAADLFYAPDPSSQTACTIGGNVAENSGGPHCLKYGTTVNHVRSLVVVLPDATALELGSAAEDPPGYDVCGLFVGSEGTLGIATEIRLRLMRVPAATRTLLAAFPEVTPATEAVSAIVAAGIVPVALEMMDRAIIQAIEDSHYRAGYPRAAGAVLLVELEGVPAGLDALEGRVRELCAGRGCSEFRAARDAAERAALWAGRKGAFGACGRLKPNMYLSDTVVPRNKLAEVLEEVYRIAVRRGIPIANVFHAGDGNLHPILLYDQADAEETARMLSACRDIVEVSIAAGGSLSGEHGIGFDKREYMSLQFGPADLDAMLRVKRAFDPDGICNPEKIIPERRGCGERGGLGGGAGLPEGVWV